MSDASFLRRAASAAAALLLLGGWLQAERIYKLNGRVGTSASYDNNPQLDGAGSLGNLRRQSSAGFGVYPSLTLDSEGAKSAFRLSYALGATWFESDADLNFRSHQLGAVWRNQLNSRWSMAFSNAFLASPDFTGGQSPIFGTINAFGVEFETITDFETVAVRRDSFANSSSLSFDYTLSPAETLAFGLSHDVRSFDEEFEIEGTVFLDERGSLQDQNRFNGFARYSRSINARTRWFAEGQVDHLDFKDFQNSRVLRGSWGLDRELGPDTDLRLSLGPSYADFLQGGGDSLGYNARISIRHILDANQFILSYRRSHGSSGGVGTVSRSDHFRVDFQRPLSRRLRLNLAGYLFDRDQLADNPVQVSGYGVESSMDFWLTDRLAIRFGGRYIDQEGDDTTVARRDSLDLVRSRAYVTLIFDLPELWVFRQ